MTEKDFLRQVWRVHDQITTTDGVPGKVIGVSFTTKSVRAFVSGAPEWVSFALIETHTTGHGKDGDETAMTEQLRQKLDFASQRVEVQQERIRELEEKLARNYAGDLLKNVNVILNVCREKKARAEKMEACMEQILQTLESIGADRQEEQ